MFKIRNIAVAAALVLVATGAMASNFRTADQVYVPAAGHLNASGGTFISDVFIQNMTNDRVTVSVIFTGTTNLAGAKQEPQYRNDLFTLEPRERREFVDFVGSAQGLGQGSFFGTLIFNGCRATANCTVGQDEFGGHPDYRDIAVFSRIYFVGPNGVNAGTTGQAFPGIPWYNYASMRANSQGLNRLSITGFRQTGFGGNAGTYRGNVGVMNASQFSKTTLLLKLFTGTGTQLSERRITLEPLNHVQGNLTDIFSGLTTGPTSVNLYVTVEQESSEAVAGAPGTCGTDGCPGFLAYGAVLDNISGDGTTLEAVYEKPINGTALEQIYGSAAGKPNYRRAVRR
jgi:hypothetical protein